MAGTKRKLQAVVRLDCMSVFYAAASIGATMLSRDGAALTLLACSISSLIAGRVVEGVAEGFRRAIADARYGRFS